MKTCVVLACSASKIFGAPTFEQSGRKIEFVADPGAAVPKNPAHRRPDDAIGEGNRGTWRDEVVAVNTGAGLSRGISLTGKALTPAVDLYAPNINKFRSLYQDLMKWTAANGHDFAILSGGWGWLEPKFLLPDYDIDFRNEEKHPERWRPGGGMDCGPFNRAGFQDFNVWPSYPAGSAVSAYVPTVSPGVEKIVFLAGQAYINLFCHLTKGCPKGILKEIFVWGRGPANCSGSATCPYPGAHDGNRRTWYYEAARDIIDGKITL
jgi:hypothetical protein